MSTNSYKFTLVQLYRSIFALIYAAHVVAFAKVCQKAARAFALQQLFDVRKSVLGWSGFSRLQF